MSPSDFRGQSQKKQNDIIMPLLERVGLEEYKDQYPHTLSGGQQQRIALARALAPNPQVMLMDEPFSGLDVALRDKIRDQTLGILKDMGVPTLLVTHDPEEAMRLSDKIAIMEKGRIIQFGRPRDIYFNPASSQVVQFFGHMNQLTGIVQQGTVTTPLGDINAGKYPDGQQVDIFARAQAIRVYCSRDTAEDYIKATVVRTSIIGATTLLTLSIEGVEDHYLALYPTRDYINAGSEVYIELEPTEVFVFAK